MRLSKSKLVAYRQCPKRLWLQTYRRELAQQSEAVENRMAQGNRVGAAAQRLYPEGRLIGHVTDLTSALRETDEALAQPGDVTLFEPALRCADVLVRADVLIRRDGRYRMIEVKASTKVKDSHVTDAAIQTWVARGAGLDVERVELAHIDNRFVYPGDGDYRGLFAHADMTDAVIAAAGADSCVDCRRAARPGRANAGRRRRPAMQRSVRVRVPGVLFAGGFRVSGGAAAQQFQARAAVARRRLCRPARRSARID